jgi:hypothetical protein
VRALYGEREREGIHTRLDDLAQAELHLGSLGSRNVVGQSAKAQAVRKQLDGVPAEARRAGAWRRRRSHAGRQARRRATKT